MGTRRPPHPAQGQLIEVTFIQEVLGPSASRHVGLLAPRQEKHLSYWGDHMSGGRTRQSIPCCPPVATGCDLGD